MDKSTIQTLIDKVIGKKGLIRVPSWWMRKVLMQIADWVQEGDDANDEKIVKVKEEADAKISTLDNNTKAALVELKKSLHTQKCFVVKTGANASYVVVDGVTQDIPANTQKIVTFTDTFKFSPDSGSRYQPIEFIGLAVTDASTMTTMKSMFSGCDKLTSIDLSGLNVSSVTDMNGMFSSCDSIKSINLLGMDTSSVTNMSRMFYYCINLSSIDLSGLNTSKVTDMSHMFSECKGLESVDFSGFDTSKVIDMSYIFSDCEKLKSIDLLGFNTSAVTNMSGMFNLCRKLASLNLSNFDTSKVTNMSNMFYNCEKLESVDLSKFNTSAVTNMGEMFGGYRYEGTEYISGFTSLDLSSFDTSNVANMNRMFNYCKKLTFLDLSSFDTSSAEDMYYMFDNCSNLTSLILGPNFFKTSKVTSVDFSSSTKWTGDTVVTSLVTNSYDRATAGLSTMTLQLSANTKAALTDEQKAAITAKGYTIA